LDVGRSLITWRVSILMMMMMMMMMKQKKQTKKYGSD
jgi:preprotein translocase subunit YajC